MKNKLMMVVGAAVAKVFPILFGLYLSRVFGFADYANFILIVTYAAALTAVAAMGSAPQILRLGAVDEPDKHVITVVTIGVLFTVVLVVLSSIFWFFLAAKPLAAQSDGFGLFLLGEMALGLIFYAISQAIFNVNGKFRAAGTSSIVTYAGSAVLGMSVGFVWGVDTLALLAYFTFFMVASLLFFIISQRHYIKTWRMYNNQRLTTDKCWMVVRTTRQPSFVRQKDERKKEQETRTVLLSENKCVNCVLVFSL